MLRGSKKSRKNALESTSRFHKGSFSRFRKQDDFMNHQTILGHAQYKSFELSMLLYVNHISISQSAINVNEK
jgi:hypothetical protein